jgi:hypothetical protein
MGMACVLSISGRRIHEECVKVVPVQGRREYLVNDVVVAWWGGGEVARRSGGVKGGGGVRESGHRHEVKLRAFAGDVLVQLRERERAM